MKRLLSIAALTTLSAAALLPLSASAQTRVHVTIGDPAPVRVQQRYYGNDYRGDYRSDYRYAQPARYYRGGHDSRGWVDRNRDGMDDRYGGYGRGGRDRDRDGVADRYDRDLDNDGVPNRYDRDIDGDGVRNSRDRRPENRYRY